MQGKVNQSIKVVRGTTGAGRSTQLAQLTHSTSLNMVCMGRNLICKTAEGIWTKLEPKVSLALPLRIGSRLPF